MTINEKRQLSNYIKGLVRESLSEAIGEGFNVKPDSDYDSFGNPKYPEGVFSTGDPKAAKKIRDDFDSYDAYYGESPEARNNKEKLANLIDKRANDEDAELDRRNYGRYEMEDEYGDEEKESQRYERPFDDDDEIENQWKDEPGYEEDEEDEPAGLDELRQLAESYARQSLAKILSEGKKRKNKKKKSSSKDKTVVSQLNADGTNAAHYYYKLYGVENGTDAEKAAARSKGYKKAKGKKNDTGVPYKFTSKERNRLNSLLTDKK